MAGGRVMPPVAVGMGEGPLAPTPLLARSGRMAPPTAIAAGSCCHKGVLLAACALLLALSGCGQKGPLYRPDEAPEVESGLSAERASGAIPEAAASHDRSFG
ncbi:LPS translocon maturation chaperone LptM [Thiohalorhabdus sp.]|uniref:LPS translocon maturation chaperone LptM n=1 Tax=Thiohalorhabdus sp. TaxID=3094134 RepID=UPI002FC2A63C